MEGISGSLTHSELMQQLETTLQQTGNQSFHPSAVRDLEVLDGTSLPGAGSVPPGDSTAAGSVTHKTPDMLQELYPSLWERQDPPTLLLPDPRMKYTRLLQYYRQGRELCRQYSRLDLDTLRYKHSGAGSGSAVSPGGWVQDTLSLITGGGSGSSSSSSSRKMDVQFQIQQLEGEVRLLEAEKITGRRDIDTIQGDIDALRDQVVQLKRKYLNWFYYF